MMGQILGFPANTDGNRIAEIQHGIQQDAIDSEREKIRSEFEGVLATWLSRSPAVMHELAELIADDLDAIKALLIMNSLDPLDASLHLKGLADAYCDRVETDKLANASLSVIEDECRPEFSDDDYQAAQIKLEEFAKELRQ